MLSLPSLISLSPALPSTSLSSPSFSSHLLLSLAFGFPELQLIPRWNKCKWRKTELSADLPVQANTNIGRESGNGVSEREWMLFFSVTCTPDSSLYFNLFFAVPLLAFMYLCLYVSVFQCFSVCMSVCILVTSLFFLFVCMHMFFNGFSEWVFLYEYQLGLFVLFVCMLFGSLSVCTHLCLYQNLCAGLDLSSIHCLYIYLWVLSLFFFRHIFFTAMILSHSFLWLSSNTQAVPLLPPSFIMTIFLYFPFQS